MGRRRTSESEPAAGTALVELTPEQAQALKALPKSLKGLVRARTFRKDPLQDFIRRIPGGKASVLALLEQSEEDEDAVKIVAAWKRIRGIDGTSRANLNFTTLLDEAEISTREFVGIVTRCAWDLNMEVAKGIFALRYPQMMEASMLRAVEPDATREREIHFQATGHMPTSKGIQIGIQQNNSQAKEQEQGEAPPVAYTARRIVRDLPPV